MSQDVFSFLEFGAIDPSAANRLTWDFRTGQKAYDWLMVARYLNDLICYRDISSDLANGDFRELVSRYKKEMHHQKDWLLNFQKLLALSLVAEQKSGKSGSKLSFLEFGSTIFGCIEGMAFANGLLAHCGNASCLKLEEVSWYGIDNSPMLNKVAHLTHPGFDIHTEEQLDDNIPQCDLFFAKGVSLLYQVRSISELMSIVDRGDLALFDYSVSLTGERDFYIGSGKNVRYLDLGETVDALDSDQTVTKIRKSVSHFDDSRDRLIFTCVRGQPESVDAYIALEKKMLSHVSSSIQDGAFRNLLFAESFSNNEDWVRLREFVKER